MRNKVLKVLNGICSFEDWLRDAIISFVRFSALVIFFVLLLPSLLVYTLMFVLKIILDFKNIPKYFTIYSSWLYCVLIDIPRQIWNRLD